jgi:transcriptional regulator with GAF, ATPase, and Fis domain
MIDVTEQHEAGAALQAALEEIKQLKDQLYDENVALREEIDETWVFEEIVGKCAALRQTLAQVETVAATDSTVLIYGETGTIIRGVSVFHCHLLKHEDNGMLAKILFE